MRKAIAIIIYTILLLPLLVLALNSNKQVLVNENRMTHPLPTLDIKHPGNFIEDFDEYFKDNFGFRSHLFNTYSHIKFKVLKEDPLPLKMFSGKNGFYFLGEQTDNVFTESMGLSLFTTEELKQIEENIKHIANTLEKSDIAFYLVIAPNKHTIYPENMPFTLCTNKTKRTQLNQLMDKQPGINFIDLTPTLLAAKDTIQVYHKTDTHWNDQGAFLAYQKIMQCLTADFSQLKSLEFSSFKQENHSATHADLPALINQTIAEQQHILTPYFDYNSHQVAGDSLQVTKALQQFVSDKNKLSALFIRDSFCSAMIKYFREGFGKTTFAWTPFVKNKSIRKFEPDIVILQVVERNIDALLECNRLYE